MERLNFLIILLLGLLQLASGLKWCYNHESCGPTSDEWDKQCTTGKEQSPINIPTDEISDGESKIFLYIPTNRYKSEKTILTNNARTVMVSMNKTGNVPAIKVVWNGNQKKKHTYTLEQIHFHGIGSEHCINSKCFASEVHFIHYHSHFNSLTDALNSGNKRAVLVVAAMLKMSESVTSEDSPIYEVVKRLNDVVEPGMATNIKAQINLNKFFKGDEAYYYTGSLTTPPCTQQIEWFVMKNPVKVTLADLNAFLNLKSWYKTKLYPNIRKTQAVNGRKIRNVAVKYLQSGN